MQKRFARVWVVLAAMVLVASFVLVGARNVKAYAEDVPSTHETTTSADDPTDEGTSPSDESAAPTTVNSPDATGGSGGSDTGTPRDDGDDGQRDPAQTLTATLDDGTVVTIQAGVGVLPAGTTVEAQIVDNQTVIDAITTKTQDNGDIKAIDVTLHDKAGNEIQPNGKVTVTFSKTGMDTDTVSVYHVTEANGQEETADDASKLTVEQVRTTTATANEQVFEADHFSIYAITSPANPRLQVIFYQKDRSTEAATMLVKRRNTQDEVNRIVYDPGAGALEDNEVFRGWTTDPNYTADTTPIDIDVIRQQAYDKAHVLGDTQDMDDGVALKLYPMVYKVYKVTYLDERGASLGTKNVLVPWDQVAPAPFTVDMDYTPRDDEHLFEGWHVQEGGSNIADYAAGATYNNGDAITISGDVTLSVNAPEGHWLVFDENGGGATYNAPVFFKEGEGTQRPVPDSQMTRKGYTFGGWYTDQACTDGNEFAFGGTLSDRTTIYAKWIPEAQARYTVLIWKQNTRGDGYDFGESVVLDGTTGDIVSAVRDWGSGNDAYVSVDGVNKQYGGFHLNHYDHDVTIAPEGSTVVNVYYDRTQYTLTFYDGSHRVKTITALYGQDIIDEFPIVGSNGRSYAGYVWTPLDSHVFTSGDVPTLETMPAENTTFEALLYSRTDHMRYLNYYTEVLSGEAGGTFWQGRRFTLHQQVQIRGAGYSTEVEDFHDIAGFDKFGSDPRYDGSGRILFSEGNHYTVNLYYIRRSYQINYMDGVCVDGDGNPISETNQGQLHTVGSIPYNADLSSYDRGGANWYVPTRSGYVFEGWYTDDQCTQPYDFTRMPTGGITVYAKWRQVQYRVFLHPNAGTDPTLDWGSSTTPMNFLVDYGSTASLPMGQRGEYEFVGWYTDPACTHLYSTATKLNDSTVTAAYDKGSDMTTPMDKWGNGATSNEDATQGRFWVTRKLDLYAKWRKKIVGATGIEVSYDANGGGNAPSDAQLYLDAADAVAGAASTAPEGKQFEYWVLQQWDAGQGRFIDTDTHVYPGDKFTVRKDDARQQANADNTPDHPSYTYTVQLRAEYGDKGSPLMTTVRFDANGGTLADGSDASERSIEVNSNVPFPTPDPTRAGYTFLGWTNQRHDEVSDPTTVQVLDTTRPYAADNLDDYAWDADQGKNVLYAVWQPKTLALTLRKEVKGEEADLTKTYDFTVSVTHDGTTYTGTATLGDTSLADGDGQTATFTTLTADDGSTYELRYGDTITIAESSVSGYSTQYQVLDNAVVSGASGDVVLTDGNVSIDDQGTCTSTIVYTNTKDNIVITGIKAVVGSGALPLVLVVGSVIAVGSVIMTRHRRTGWGE